MIQSLEIQRDQEEQEEIQLDQGKKGQLQQDEEEEIDLDIGNNNQAEYNHVPKAEMPEREHCGSQDSDGQVQQLKNINVSMVITKRQANYRDNNHLLITYDPQKNIYHIADNQKIRYPDKTNYDFQRLHLQLVSKEFYMEAWLAQDFTLKKQFIESWIKTLWIQYMNNPEINKVLKTWLNKASEGNIQIPKTIQKIKQYGLSFFVKENKNKLQLIINTFQKLRKCSQELSKSFKENTSILGSLTNKFISHPNYLILRICQEIKTEELQFYKLYSRKKAVFIIQKHLQSKGQKLNSKFDRFKSKVQEDDQKVNKHKILQRLFTFSQK